ANLPLDQLTAQNRPKEPGARRMFRQQVTPGHKVGKGNHRFLIGVFFAAIKTALIAGEEKLRDLGLRETFRPDAELESAHLASRSGEGSPNEKSYQAYSGTTENDCRCTGVIETPSFAATCSISLNFCREVTLEEPWTQSSWLPGR